MNFEKYLLPWEPVVLTGSKYTTLSVRKLFINNKVFATVGYSSDEVKNKYAIGLNELRYETLEQAQKAYDDILIEWGYTLIQEDEVEKYRKLQLLL